MATEHKITSRGALTALVLAAAAVVVAAPERASTGATPSESHVRIVRSVTGSQDRSSTYGWPVKPFDRQHPVRAFLNDPRIGKRGEVAFHFGIDIAVPDGTAVYAVEAGKVFFSSRRAIAVESRDRGHEFGYWHIVPVVKSHQLVRRHQLLGYVDTGWEHVHFAERRGGEYVNPLRDGGLGPYSDHTPPTIDTIELDGDDLIVEAHDTPDPRVPGAWAGEPVTAAVLRWRVGSRGPWQPVIDEQKMLPQTAFRRIYTPDTLQNHKGEPGRFRYYLLRNAAANGLAGTSTIEVQATDTAGNAIVAAAEIGAGYEQ